MGLISLELVNLADNVIEEIDPFCLSPFQLQVTIILDNNKLTVVNESVLAMNTTKLLQIKGNALLGQPSTPLPSFTFNTSVYETVDLSGCGLEVLPCDGIFIGATTIKTLILAHCKISMIENRSLRDMASLVTMDMSNNKLTIILNESFWGNLKSLEKLDLSSNLINTIEGNSFQHLSQLLHIHFTGNSLGDLEEFMFQGLSSSISLLLKDSGVTDIKSFSFSGLDVVQTIDLSLNNIPDIKANDTFFGLANLSSLILANSKIKTIYPHAFSQLSNLSSLDLHGNDLATVQPFTFYGLSRLDNIILYNTGIYNLQPMALYGLQSVQNLDLTENYINPLLVNAFARLDSLLFLDLSYNHFVQEIEPYSFANLSQLKSLNLTKNKLSNLKANTFYGLSNLTEIVLSSSLIYSIEPGAFNGMAALKKLELISNRILMIQSYTFNGMDSLEILDITFNNNWKYPLAVIEAYAFANISTLKLLFLRKNKIDTIGNLSLAAVGSIEEITLDDTNLNVIKPFGFKDLSKVKVLNLSKNKLTVLYTDTFNGMAALETLIIDKCHIHTLEELAFRGIPQLHTLSLCKNKINTIHNRSLAQLHVLRSIDLSQNQLEQIPLLNDSAQTLLSMNLKSNLLTQLRVGEFFIYDALSVLNLDDNDFVNLPNHSWVDDHNNLTNVSITIDDSISLHPLFFANLTMVDYLTLASYPKIPNLTSIISHIKTLIITDFLGRPEDLNPFSLIKSNVTEESQITVGVETLEIGPNTKNLQKIPTEFLNVFTKLKYLTINKIGLIEFPDFTAVTTLKNITIRENNIDITTMNSSKLTNMHNLTTLTFIDCEIKNFTWEFMDNLQALKEFYFKSLLVVPDFRAFLKPPLVLDIFDVYQPGKSECLISMCWIAEYEQQGVYPQNPNTSLTSPIYQPTDMPCNGLSSFYNIPWVEIDVACLCLGKTYPRPIPIVCRIYNRLVSLENGVATVWGIISLIVLFFPARGFKIRKAISRKTTSGLVIMRPRIFSRKGKALALVDVSLMSD